jgi:hypothetical protein
MLLIDGVKYELWTPPSEDEFEQIVKEHAQDIFGEDSIYFDLKKGLITKAGIGTIPDGYVISFQNPPCWYICEVELHLHPLYAHIVPQITKFINSVKSFETQREIINALDREISGDPFKETIVKNRTGSSEVYRFIANLISKPPILAIVIDQKTQELEEVCGSLPIEVKVVEFKTYIREGVGLPVHAHLFEPLRKPPPNLPQIPSVQTTISQSESIFISLPPSSLRERHYIHLPEIARKNNMFPLVKTVIQIGTDQGSLETELRISNPHGRLKSSWLEGGGLDKWFIAHPELEVGDTLRITVIEPMKKYRLEIVK